MIWLKLIGIIVLVVVVMLLAWGFTEFVVMMIAEADAERAAERAAEREQAAGDAGCGRADD